MTLFCGSKRKLSLGLAFLSCASTAMAAGPFKPASYGQLKESASESEQSSQMGYSMPSGPMMYGSPEYAMAAGPMPGGMMPGGQMPGGQMPGGPMGGMPMMNMPGGVGGPMIPGSPMGGMPMGPGGPMSMASMQMGPEMFPGQYMEASTQGEYVYADGCDTSGSCGGCGCGGMGCGGCGYQFGDGLGCGPVCGPHGRCVGDGRNLNYLCSSMTGLANRVLMRLLPYGEGGVATQRWYDVSVEAMVLQRDKDVRDTVLATRGIAGPPALSTSDVYLNELQPGLAIQLNVQTGPGSNLEVVYFGLNRWHESARATGNNDLYSVFSNFGQTPNGGFDDTDRSSLQTIDYISTIHNGEVNLRRRWVEPTGFLQGSFLGGLRYFDLDENFTYRTRGDNTNSTNASLRFSDYNVETRNQMVGFQLGADLWVNVVPGVKLGTEVKSGIYGNNSTQSTLLNGNSVVLLNPTGIINEVASDGRAAYLTQWSVSAWYRLSYAIAIKSSFQMMYVDNVALATENVNTVPLAQLPDRLAAVRVNNDGELLYTGYTIGAEYTW